MRAVVSDGREPPRLADLSEPGDEDGLVPVAIRAAPLTNLDVLVARGQHYFSPKDQLAVVGARRWRPTRRAGDGSWMTATSQGSSGVMRAACAKHLPPKVHSSRLPAPTPYSS